jgi:hypothetical protein
MRDGICIVATVSCGRFEKDVGDFELKNLVIVLVGANFVHGVISPKRTPQVSLGLHDKRCEPRHRRGAFCRRLGLYDRLW